MHPSRLIPSARAHGAAAIAVLSALTLGAPVAALQASSSNTPIDEIEIVGTPKLYVQTPADPRTYNSVWIVFRTRTHLHEPRQIVVRVKDRSGRSYGNAGGRNCIRSTVVQAARLLKPGNKYRVEFRARRSSRGTATTVLTRRILAAHRHNAGPGFRPPRC